MLPTLSAYDPALTTEGSLDPLGLSIIAESLGNTLAPGIRERQHNPRFLTIMAVGNALCQDFDSERVAKDGKSAPWQVYEWYVVEGLVRATPQGQRLENLPGIAKTGRVVRDGFHLNASRYLKTPGTFGFHGVYRTLAENLNVEREGILGEAGYRLLRNWMDAHGLSGFHGSGSGGGKRIKSQLQEAIRDGLEAGEVARSGGWEGWQLIAQYLSPMRCEGRESDLVLESLLDPNETFRSRLVEYLQSDSGAKAWETNKSEREFHEAFIQIADPELASLIHAIMEYEAFCRALLDAFDAIRLSLTRARAKSDFAALGKDPEIIRAAKAIPDLFQKAHEALQQLAPILPRESLRFQERFAAFEFALRPEAFAKELLGHHARIQKAKPPNGRLPWIDVFPNGDTYIRPMYQLLKWTPSPGAYVAGYRTAPVSSFLGVLQRVGDGA
jgi:hypothetical protein